MSGKPRVVIRLEARVVAARPGEVRLLKPLGEGALCAGAIALPPVDGDFGDALVQSIHDLHSGLAHANSDLAWWYLPVAEWQPNMSALPAALDLTARLESLARRRQGRFVLTVPDALTAAYLQDYFADHESIAVVAGGASRARWLFRRAKATLVRFVNAGLWLAENARIVRDVRSARVASRLPKRIDTLFVSRIEPGFLPLQDGVWRDAYLGALPEEGRARTGSTALLLRNGGDPVRQINSIAGFKGFPVALVFEFLSLRDLWDCSRRAMRFRLAVPAAPGPLARAASEESRGHVCALADWLVVERAMRNILKSTVARQIVCMQENSGWEFAVVRAASAAARPPKTFGFFHCPVMPSAQRYRTRVDVLARRPNFTETITLGSAMRNALLRLGDWAPVLSAEHYAFRNPELTACYALPIRAAGAPLRLLIVLGGVFDNGRFLEWVKAATASIDNIAVVIKPHPSFDYRAAVTAAGIDFSDGRFTLSPHRRMDLALGEADVLLYKGTTVCFAALAAGIPAIHVNDGGIASDDTLFDAGDLGISIGDQAALVQEIERIRSQTYETREAWAKRSRAYVREYYDLTAESRAGALDRLFPKTAGASFVAANLEEVEARCERT